MTERSHTFVLVWIALVACGERLGPPKLQDANPDVAIAVTTASCPSGAPTITTLDHQFLYMPQSVAIAQGGVVQFVMSPLHAVDSSPNDIAGTSDRWDPGLHVDFGATTCLTFSEPGTYRFHCPADNFRGNVVVQ